MTVFDVKLDKFDAAYKIKVIKEVRGFTELGLKEAKDLVEKAPVVVKKGVSKEEGDSPDSVLSSDSSLKIPWTFDSGTEKMYLLKGKVNIYCDEQDDEPFQIAAGDLVEFPNAMQIVFETRDLVVSYSIPNVVTCGNVPLESSFQKVPRIRQFFWGHYRCYFDFLISGPSSTIQLPESMLEAWKASPMVTLP